MFVQASELLLMAMYASSAPAITPIVMEPKMFIALFILCLFFARSGLFTSSLSSFMSIWHKTALGISGKFLFISLSMLFFLVTV